MPITWKNIDAPSNFAANQLLGQGANSIQSGFDIFKGLVDDSQRVVTGNEKQLVENNTQAFLDRLASVKTPEEMAQLQASGQLDQMKQQFGAMINRDAIRNAEANRIKDLRQDVLAERAYNDSNLEFGNRGNVAEFNKRIAAGDIAGAESLIGQMDQNIDLSKFTDRLDAERDELREEGRANKRFAREQTGWDQADYRFERSQLEDDRQDKEWTQQDANAQTLADLRQAIVTRTQEADRVAAGYEEIAAKHGITDLDNATPRQIDFFKRDVRRAGLDKYEPVQDTKFVDRQMKKLLAANPTMDAQTAAAARAELESRVTGEDTLLPNDQAEIDKAVLRKSEELEMANNMYMQPRKSADVEAKEIIANDSRIKEWNGSERAQVTRMINDALTKGVNINGEMIPVTPAMVQNALVAAGNAWSEIDDNLETVLKEQIASGGVTKQYRNFKQFKKEEAEIRAAGQARFGAMKNTDATIEKYRSKLNLPKPTQR